MGEWVGIPFLIVGIAAILVGFLYVSIYLRNRFKKTPRDYLGACFKLLSECPKLFLFGVQHFEIAVGYGSSTKYVLACCVLALILPKRRGPSLIP